MATNKPSWLYQLSSGPQFSISELDAALKAEIQADENERRLRPVRLGRGLRRSRPGTEAIYEFVSDEPLRTGDRGAFRTEGQECRAQVTGRRVDGRMRPTVLLRLQTSFGRIAPAGILTLDPGPVEELRQHLAELPEDFNYELAKRAVGALPHSAFVAEAPDLGWLSNRLNEEQLESVGRTFTCPVSLTWGPPGTGKTRALIAAAEAHVRAGQTVMVVAPTHGALDRCLEVAEPWLNTIPGYGDGAVLRLGRIECPTLSRRMGVQIELGQVLRQVADRRNKKLKALTKAKRRAVTAEGRSAFDGRLVQLRDAKPPTTEALVGRAKVIFATTHRSYLPPLVPKQWPMVAKSTVLVDEAGMVSLPLLFATAGLATQRVALFGDFRQIPPVVMSRTSGARQWLGRTGFEGHQIPAAISASCDPPHLTVLRVQHRMAPSICDFVSDNSYAGRLQGAPLLHRLRPSVPALSGGALNLLDTTRLAPTTDFKRRSRFNTIHAELLVELIRSIEEDVDDSVTTLVLTPFRAQVETLNLAFRSAGLRTKATTIHSAQGAEVDIAIVDLVETDGAEVSHFLAARGPDDEGARLLNVAVSRAKRAVVVVAAVDPLLRSPLTGRYVKAFLTKLQVDAAVLDPFAYLRRADSLAA